jgi:DNA-directed RNA polymerase subunit RPC12/RpoP
MSTKLCKTCLQELPIDSFNFQSNKKYRQVHCRSCYSKRQLARQTPEQKKRNSDWIIDWHYRKRYGVTKQFFYELAAKQENKCAICNCHLEFKGTKGKAASLDHNHLTGEIRGVLCGSCNKALGLLQDNVEVLQKAIIYLTCECKVGMDLKNLEKVKYG